MNRLKQKIKSFLFRFLGTENYLKLLNIGFFKSYYAGFLKNNEQYQYHYFVKKFIRQGDTVVDIGANLGYFTKLFSDWVGDSGEVIAIEPVPLYNKINKWACRRRKNITYLPYALGTENRKVYLVTPDHFGYLRTGLPHIFDENSGKKISDFEFSFEAEMKNTRELFEKFSRIDFLKCDIEGYEEIVIPQIIEILKKYKPVIQIETWGTHKAIVETCLQQAGFIKYFLLNRQFMKAATNSEDPPGDLIFIHETKVQEAETLKTN